MLLNDQLIDLPTLYHVIDRFPLTISPDSYVVDAIALMNQERINSFALSSLHPSLNSSIWRHQGTSYILVVEGNHLLGIFTERDVVRLAASGIDLSRVKMAEVMTPQPVTLKQSDAQDVLTALSLLHQHQIRHLPIVEAGGQLVGIVTETSLLQAFDLVKMVGVVAALQQNLQLPQAESRQINQQIEAVRCQTQTQLKRWVEAQSAEVIQANEELQQTLEELQIIEEELRQQNEELAVAREIAELERQRYQDLFEFAPDAYLVTDTAGIIKEANHVAATLLCVGEKYLVGKPLVVFIAQEDSQTFMTRFQNLPQLQHWEVYLQPRAGPSFPARIKVAAVHDAQGQRIGWRWLLCNISEQQTALRSNLGDRQQVEAALYQATVELEKRVVERTAELSQANALLQQEITERKQMEAALRQSEDKFRHFAENTHAVIWIASPQSFQILYVNPAYEKVWGRSCQSMIEQTLSWIETVHPEDRDRVRQTVEQQLSNESASAEYRILRPDGKVRWIWDRSFAIYNERGLVEYYGGIAEDITDRKQVEAALRQSEEKFRHFADNADVLIWIGNPESGENLYVNSVYERIWGRSCQSLRDQPNSWAEAIYPEDRDRVMAKLARQKLGESTDTEYRIVRPDGSVRWIWDRGFAIEHEQGKIYSYGGIVQDITKRKQAEGSLHESEVRLTLALDAAQMGIWDWNLLTNTCLWSANMAPLYGLPSGLCNPTIEDITQRIHPEDREPLAQATARIIEEGTPLVAEYRVIWPDGSLHWLNIRGQVHYDETGQPIRVIGTARDISDRKQAEAALRESEERYRSVVTALCEGIVVIDADGTIIACNASAENILGVSTDYLIGNTSWRNDWRTIHEDGLPFLSENYPVVVTLRTGQPCSNVVMGIYTPNGQLNWVMMNSQPLLRDNDPQPYAVVLSFNDISDRKQAEQKIYEQAALLDIVTDAIYVQDFQSQILFWNQGAQRLYGWQTHEVVGENPNELFFAATSPPQVEAAVKTVIESGSWQGELHKVTKTGTKIIVESRWTLMHDAAGQPKSILIVDNDITEKKQLQSQFYRTQRLESLGTLSSGIAHDLNNILTPVMAASQLLKVKFPQDNERYQQLLTIIESNAKRGAALVKQVLSFARGFKGERTIVQVKHLIADIIQIARQTFPKSIDFSTQIPEELWAVFGDTTQLHQVLMNLVVNARDAMLEGGILSIEAENMFIDEAYTRMNLDAKVGHYIVITVADTGIGMSPEILDHIFEPFFTTKEIGSGTGLGLSTALGIIKSHNGFVNVASQVSKGTQFKVFLPSVEPTQVLGTDDLEMPQGEGELILVVDDEAQIREIATMILEHHNYKIITACNGIEAIALYAQHKQRISAVLMDMMMPEMDGITAIRTLQKMNSQVQIIACSGLNSAEVFTQDSTQVQAVLSKPYTAKELLQNLDHILRGSEESSAVISQREQRLASEGEPLRSSPKGRG